MPEQRVSDWIAEYLGSIGVRNVFLLSGGGMMHLLDAVSRIPSIKYICNHHEQACAMGAQGYARQSGQLGVCYATSGPGATNTVTGVAEAWMDSSPLLVITGQSKVSQTIRGSRIAGLRQFGNFEVDIVSILGPITKYAAFLDNPRDVRAVLEEAVYHATTGRPGPVVVDVPLDMQGAPVDASTLRPFVRPLASVTGSGISSAVSDAVRRLKGAKRPLVLAGHGIRAAGMVERFREVVELLNVPVVTTQLAKDALPYTHPLFVGHPGMKGDRPGNLAIQNADLILSLGASFHVTTTGYELDQFAPNAEKIQVDIDPAVLRRAEIGVTTQIVADVGQFLTEMKAAVKDVPLISFSEWHQRAAHWKSKYSVRLEPRPHGGEGVDYYAFMDALSDQLPDVATLVTDAGSAYYVVGQAFRSKANQRVIVSGGLGTMGYALPAAIGASAADPGRVVACVTGDGSLQTNVHELATLALGGFNVKLFVLNNDGYVSIRNTQTSFFGAHLAGTSRSSGVSMPSLKSLCEAYGLTYSSCGAEVALDAGLRDVLESAGPQVCEIFATKSQAILPTVTSVRLPNGAMQSKPLHDMAPLLTDDEMAANMYAT